MLGKALRGVAAAAWIGLGAIVAVPIIQGPAPIAPAVAHSHNWSGYVAEGKADTFDGVSASFTVPTLNCSNLEEPVGYDSVWVGLDGFHNKTVEQLGVMGMCDYGYPEYEAWVEMYPADPTPFNLTVQPGDKIHVAIEVVGNDFVLTFSDLTTGHSDTALAACSSCERASAEVISEAPASMGGVLPLADYGNVAFSDVQVDVPSASGKGIKAEPLISPNWPSYRVVQRQSGQVLQTPSALRDGAFVITWKAAGE